MGFERIDDLLDGVTADGTLHGVAATVVGRDGVLYEHAAGEAKPDTMFRNASMTKAVATTAALQLVEQGRVDLDATVASIVPEFGELQVLDHFEGREPVLRAPKTQATVRQLMNHTAGCGYHFLNEKLFAYCAGQNFPNPLEGVKQSISAPLVHDPGTVWEYGVSTDWVGMVVEAASGQTLADYLAEHVYGPLGMADSTFDPTDEQRARLHGCGFAVVRGGQQQDGERQDDQDSRHSLRHRIISCRAQQAVVRFKLCFSAEVDSEPWLSAPFRVGSRRIGHKTIMTGKTRAWDAPRH